MNEIMPRLYLGNVSDALGVAKYLDWAVLCVMWNGEPMYPDFAHHIETTLLFDQTTITCDPRKMDEAAVYIHETLKTDRKILVHCALGMERSPLTIVWYLMRYHAMSLAEAYCTVASKHPDTLYRGAWLPQYIQYSNRIGACSIPPLQEHEGVRT